MNVIAIFAIVALGYILLQRQNSGLYGSVGATSGSSASLANQLNRNQQLLNRQTAATLGSGGYGVSTEQLLAPGVSSGAQISGSAVAGAAGFSGAAAGATTAGIGIVAAIGLAEWAAHTARVKGATAENKGIDLVVPAFDADLREINNSWRRGELSQMQCSTYLLAVRDNYWSYMAQYQGKPGVAMRSCPGGQHGGPMGKGGCTSGQPTCDKGCTAGCCVGCSAINGSIANCLWAVQTGYHGPVAICEVFGGKFGSHDRAGYQLTW